MTLSQAPEGAIQVQQADLADHIKFFGTSGHGKSMLGRLTETERREWWEWAKAHPDINGMDWPGWAGVRAREAATMPGDLSQNIAGLVYNDAFHQATQK